MEVNGKKVAIATRFHDGSQNLWITDILKEWIYHFNDQFPDTRLYITVLDDLDKHKSSERLAAIEWPNVSIIPIKSVRTTSVLDDGKTTRNVFKNSIVLSHPLDCAMADKADILFFCSIHHRISPAGLTLLAEEFDDRTFSVGPVLYNHEPFYKPGSDVVADGGTIPTNTLNGYALKYLGITGFPPIVNAPKDRQYCENEELATVGLARAFFGNDLKVILKKVPGIERDETWYKNFPERNNLYTAEGKTIQMEYHLKQMGLPPQMVTHK